MEFLINVPYVLNTLYRYAIFFLKWSLLLTYLKFSHLIAKCVWQKIHPGKVIQLDASEKRRIEKHLFYYNHGCDTNIVFTKVFMKTELFEMLTDTKRFFQSFSLQHTTKLCNFFCLFQHFLSSIWISAWSRLLVDST